MIVRTSDDRQLLITQPDHARLAAAIIERCAPLASRARRPTILRATAEHDNGWAEEDAGPTVDPETGAVVDFVSAPLPVRHRVWPRAVARLAGEPLAAALVAQHAIAVYDRFRSERAWHSFIARMESERDAMLMAAGLPLDELLADYVFVRLGDLVSLAFCAGWTDEHRAGEWIVRATAERIVVAPDPFAGAVIPIEIAARAIPNERFRSDAQLRRALVEAPRILLHGEAMGAPDLR